MNSLEQWHSYCKSLCDRREIGLRLDTSRMQLDESFLTGLSGPLSKGLAAMAELERGAIANASENRMVGHYWLRAPELAPASEITDAIKNTIQRIKNFATGVHCGEVLPQRGEAFYIVLIVGIGGSVLGAQFLHQALSGPDDPVMVRFLDNTDPGGISQTLNELHGLLDQTLTIVVSKSGDTIETRNGMLEVAAAYRAAGLQFPAHAVAVTCPDSKLELKAKQEKWLNVFHLWPWVGGRFSICSATGLLPLALIARNVDEFLAGARDCDAATRDSDVRRNPAAILAAACYGAGNARGDRNMVVLPYRDRLAVLPRYLQQLVMESLGKSVNRRGEIVHQGLNVFGNKGSTDQHSFVQQLRDGRDDFFVTFIESLEDDANETPVIVEAEATCGDYLHGFLHGTREALTHAGRRSMTLTVDRVDEFNVGAMAALFERAVGLYGELIDVNAYDQPGVEAGKKAASRIIELQRQMLIFLRNNSSDFTAEEIAAAIGFESETEQVWHLLEHLAASRPSRVTRTDAQNPCAAKYRAS